MKHTKFLTTISIILILTLCLCGCGKKETATQEEQGGFSDVDIKEEDTSEEQSGYSPYKELSDDLGYEYKTVKSDYMALKFQVPKNWDVQFVNARIIRLDAPENDNNLPGYTFYIDCTMGTKGDEILIPSMFEQFFEQDREALKYNIDGTEYFEAYNETASQVYSTTDIADNTESFSILEYDDVYAEDSQGISSRDTVLNSIHFNVDWSEYHNFEYCFEAISARSLVKEADTKTATTLLTHIVSTFEGYKAPAPSTRTYTACDVTFTLPEDFEEYDSNSFYVPVTKNSEYAGMYVGVFNVDLGLDNFNELTYAKGPEVTISNAFMGSSSFNIMGSLPYEAPSTIAINGKSATLIYSDITYIANSNNVKSGNFYGLSGSADLYVYDISTEKENKQIAFWYDLQQIYASDDIKELLETKTTF